MGDDDREFRFNNYLNRYQGEMSLAEGLAQSVNTIAVQVAERAGIPRVIAAANRLGITSPLARDASISLGTGEVNLLELVSAYAPFANGGTGILGYGISEIRDTAGKTLYRRSGSGPGPVVAAEGTEKRMKPGVPSRMEALAPPTRTRSSAAAGNLTPERTTSVPIGP